MRITITTRRARRAAEAAAKVLATSPDPAKAVAAARTSLGAHADRYRIGVSRPGVVGRTARATVTHAEHPAITATATAEVTR